ETGESPVLPPGVKIAMPIPGNCTMHSTDGRRHSGLPENLRSQERGWRRILDKLKNSIGYSSIRTRISAGREWAQKRGPALDGALWQHTIPAPKSARHQGCGGRSGTN